jgi:hypothetical protein
MEDFEKELERPETAHDAYLTCYDDKAPSHCYDRAVKEKLTEYADLPAAYLAKYPFSEIQDKLMSAYKGLISSQLNLIRNQAQKLWEECSLIPASNREPPTGSDFLIADKYLASSRFNCLNAYFKTTINKTVDAISIKEKRVKNPLEEKLLRSELTPHLHSALLSFYESDQGEEKLQIKEVFFPTLERSKILANFNWIEDYNSPKAMTEACSKNVLANIAFEPAYHLKQELFLPMIQEEVCKNIQGTPEFSKWYRESSDASLEKNHKAAEEILFKLAREKAAECVIKYPMDTNLSKIKYSKQRQACLLDAWVNMEEKAAKEQNLRPTADKFRTGYYEIKSQLEEKRKMNQIIIMKEYF